MDADEGTGVARQRWSGAVTFVLAAIGSAIGLGNFWRFPYVYENDWLPEVDTGDIMLFRGALAGGCRGSTSCRESPHPGRSGGTNDEAGWGASPAR